MQQPFSRYISAEPYPPLIGIEHDAKMTRQLLTLYSGPNSELSASAQFFYYSMICSQDTHAELSEIFSAVCYMSTVHMTQLGHMILAYGGDPGFLYYPTPTRTTWWSGANLNYYKQPVQMLRQSLQDERYALDAYHRLAKTVANPSTQGVLHRICGDKERNIVLFTQTLASLQS